MLSSEHGPLEYDYDKEEEEVAKPKIGNLAPLMTSNSADWETPPWFFAALHNEFHFDVDVAASMENRKVQKFFSEHQDAFRLQWRGNCWLNPPYGRGIDRWMAKALKSAVEGATVVCLVPARTDTNWWFDYAKLGEVRFLKGRLKFVGAASAAPFPSALVIFRPGLPRSTSYWYYREIKFSPGWDVKQL